MGARFPQFDVRIESRTLLTVFQLAEAQHSPRASRRNHDPMTCKVCKALARVEEELTIGRDQASEGSQR